MVRKPVIDIMDIIMNGDNSSKKIIVGPPGCGKSSSIYQIVQYCKLKGWIVVYLPNCEILMFDKNDNGQEICEIILSDMIKLNKEIFNEAS